MSNRYVMPEKRMNIFTKAAIVTFICFCTASIISQQFTYNSYFQEQQKLESQIKDKTGELEELQELLAHDFDDDYIKKVARKSLGYHMADEIIYYNNLSK